MIYANMLERDQTSGFWVYGEQAKTYRDGPFDRVHWFDSQELAELALDKDLSERGQYRDRGDGHGPGARLVRRWVGPLELV